MSEKIIENAHAMMNRESLECLFCPELLINKTMNGKEITF